MNALAEVTVHDTNNVEFIRGHLNDGEFWTLFCDNDFHSFPKERSELFDLSPSSDISDVCIKQNTLIVQLCIMYIR